MMAHLLTQCMKVANQENRVKLKEIEFAWLAEEDVLIYFSKLNK